MNSFLARLGSHPSRTVALLGLALLLSGNWILPLLDRDEPRFAEASREMLQRGDVVVPWFNGDYRFDKPPLIYWCQMLSYRALGENYFAARLPGALFTVGTALLLVIWGRRLGRPRAGFHAALVFLTCLQVLIHGRLSVADMPMIFFVTAAMWSGWEMTRPEADRRGRWWCVFYLSLGLGFLAKGPVAWLPLGGLLLGRWLRPGAFRLKAAEVLGGLALALALVALWGIPALVATRGEFFSVGIGRHVVQRSLGVMEGHGGANWLGYVLTLPLYFLTFFLSAFPWSIRVPGALRRWWAARRQDDLGWYLLVQALVVFVVFSFVRTKLPHYTLPAFAGLALWLSLQWADEQAAASVWKTVAGMAALTLVLTLAVFPLVKPKFVVASVWREAAPHVRPETKVGAVGIGEPSLVWEFRRVTTNTVEWLKPGQTPEFLAEQSPRVLVLPTERFQAPLTNLASNAVVRRVTGLDTGNFKKRDLTVIIRP